MMQQCLPHHYLKYMIKEVYFGKENKAKENLMPDVTTFPSFQISANGQPVIADRAVCFNDGDHVKEPAIPGVKQTAVSLSCQDDELDVCIFRTFSDTEGKVKKHMTGVKLGCCNCSKYK